MIIFTKKILPLFAFLAFFMLPTTVGAATLQLDPTSVKCTVSGTCTVDVVLDAGSDQILATDARLTYDSSVVDVTAIADGTYLTIGKKDFATAGEIYIAGIVDDPAQYKTGSGTLATITFTGKKDGTTTLSFVCKPGETATDSNIAKNDLNATDIIQCSDNGSSTISVGKGTGTTTTTTSTTSTTSSSTTTPTTLPRSGILDELLKFAVPGSIMLILGIGLKFLL